METNSKDSFSSPLLRRLRGAFPFLLGGLILWWMYRGFDFKSIQHSLLNEMDWGWMLFSLVFGVTAQLFRGLRWRLSLEPLGEHPSTANCIHAVFISYASSLIIPRSGEVSRCGILAKYDGVNFAKSFGTVVTERIIDSLLVLAITAIVIISQLAIFHTFFDQTGVSLIDTLRGFTATGYLVTAICLIATVIFLWFLMRKLALFTKVSDIINNIKAGVMSVRQVRRPWLFTFYTLAIWISYFLHYWITFRCFEFTLSLSFTVAIVSFIVGSISVIVPTPNGAGPWHFAVKTILVLYGVADSDAVTFVLIVHTIQTALVPLLGAFSLVMLGLKKEPA